MQELIEEKFPFLDEDGVARVYKNIIDLVNHESVRILFLKKKQIESICSIFLQRGEVLYHHVVSTPENRFMTKKIKTTYKRLLQSLVQRLVRNN